MQNTSPIITSVHMVILMQPDLQKAVDFYQRLGGHLVFQLKDKWAEFRIGSVKLGLCPTSQSMEGHRTGIVLGVEDVHKAYNELKDTVHFFGEPKEAVHGIMVSFADPAGNILDMYQPTPEKVAEMVKKTAATADQELAEGGAKSKGCAKGTDCCQA